MERCRSLQVWSAVPEFGRFDGLADVVVHADGEAAVAIAFEGVGGHSNDGHMFAGDALAAADFERGFVAIEAGHVAVHHDDVVATGFEGTQGVVAVIDGEDGAFPLLHHADGDFLVDGVVFGEKHAQAKRCGLGRRTRLSGSVGVTAESCRC